MSAPVAAEVLKELDAEARTFGSAKGAMLWYRDQLAQRLHGANGNQLDNATFAAIAYCLKQTHPADIDDDGLEVHPTGRWSDHQPHWHTGESLLWLVAWYENTSDDGAGLAIDAGLEMPERRNSSSGFLALKAGLERRSFNRRCKKISAALHRRLVYAGVVLDSDGR